MAHAIIRVAKIKTPQGIAQRQAHNDRSKYTPNADESRRTLNHEYVNVGDRPVAELVEERMKAAGLGKPREGAVLCLEVLMTAGPNAALWKRDAETGQAADMRGSEWEQQSVAWAKKQWGDNLVAMKLHQDEKTPHFQCFVVPILGNGGGLAGERASDQVTPVLAPDAPTGQKPPVEKSDQKARLSARDMFSPQTLSQLQTDFAEAMQPFDLQRGVKGSRAQHRTMRQMYALGGETSAEVASMVRPSEAQPFVLGKPPLLGREEWQLSTEAAINAEIARQVGAVNERLKVVGEVAVAATGAAERSEHSRLWAGDSLQKADEALGNVAALTEQLRNEVSQGQAERERHGAELDKILLQAVQGNLPADLLERGQELAAQQLEALRRTWLMVSAWQLQADQAEREGDYGLVAELRYTKLPEVEQQLNDYKTQALATPAGRALITELEEGDRVAAMQAQQNRQLAAEAHERQRVEEQERAAREVERYLQAQEAKRVAREQQAAQEVEARKAQQEVADRVAAAAVVARHRETEMNALEMARSAYAGGGREIVRVRVMPAEVAHIQQSVGSSAHPDEKPGADGRIGVNITYNPGGTVWPVTRIVEDTLASGGEVFERPEATPRREQSTRADISLANDFIQRQKSRDAGPAQHEL